MAISENLFSSTQSFLTPDFVQKFSGALGQPADRIRNALNSIIPTFLKGVVDKGSSREGAESLVNIAARDGVETTSPNLNDTQYLSKGSDALNGIFGSNLDSVTSSLGSRTGINPGSINKMLGMIAPMFLGVLRKKIKNENMNANGLMSFLSQQKSALAGMGPVSGASPVQRPATSYATTNGVTTHYTERIKPLVFLAVLAAALLAGMWWWTNRTSELTSGAGVKDAVQRSFETPTNIGR